MNLRKIYLSTLLICTWNSTVLAQLSVGNSYPTLPQERYSLLLDQVHIYANLDSLGKEEKQMIAEADSYARSGEFEIAIVYLEETLVGLRIQHTESSPTSPLNILHNFSFSVLTGVDFNRQEFEIGYLESDSTVLEEINKPYIGLKLNYMVPTGIFSMFEISNEIRFDSENRRNDYKVAWRNENTLLFSYSGFWNESDELSSNSFWEHEIEARVGSGWIKRFNWSVYNIFTLKDYKNSNTYLTDFYRNRFDGYLAWNFPSAYTLSMEFMHELNESLGLKNNDYTQAIVRPGFRYSQRGKVNINIQPELLIRDYKLEYGDSLIINRYIQFGTDIVIEIPIYGSFRFELDDDFYLKNYRDKGTLEPDYWWNTVRGSVILDLSTSFDIGAGYELEIKKHREDLDDSYDVSEQNYNAHGVNLQLNYFTMKGIYVSTVVSYQWRRYPSSVTNDLFSIYSDRNIFSIILMTFLPLAENLSINGFITYDNDVDIDLDQQNNQSTIFTAELEYKF